VASTSAKLQNLLSGKEGNANGAHLDSYMQSQLNPIASQIIKKCLPLGLAVPFPKNTFSLMVNTGAKGSMVNQSQVSCSLGQQALEGRRVPRMSSGRTLPSFAPYDPSPRADGFITDRFLTGVRPQEYYFHCMAGREGLVDTAVKTSRSGYLQRCLMKHLEELKVGYDSTVRDSEGGVVQFLYGEDGIDPTKAPYLDCTPGSLTFLARNMESLKKRYHGLPDSGLQDAMQDATLVEEVGGAKEIKKGSFVKARKLSKGTEWDRGNLCRGWFEATIVKCRSDGEHFDVQYLADKTVVKNVPAEVTFSYCGGKLTPAAGSIATIIKLSAPDPIISGSSSLRGRNLLGQSGACVSEKVAADAIAEVRKSKAIQQILKTKGVTEAEFGALVASKFSSAICAPGEAVGCIAAQGIGEPSTQMTLNTFHLAGAATANVTLGIPRLREIIMTASRNLSTPTMSVPLLPSVDDREATRLMRGFTKLTLKELLSSQKGITVTETLAQSEASGGWERCYQITLRLHPSERIFEAFGMRLPEIARAVTKKFLPKVSSLMKRELKKANTDSDTLQSAVYGGESSEYTASEEPSTKKASSKKKDEYEDEEVQDEDGVSGSRFGHRKEMVSYGDMDDEERALRKSTKEDDDVDYNDTKDDEDGDDNGPHTISDEDEDNDYQDFSISGSALKIDREKNILYLRPLRVDPGNRPLLMIGLVEMAAGVVVVRERHLINQAFINDEEEGRDRCLQTAGVNFGEIWTLPGVDHTRLLSNDVWAMRCAYGVESARTTIMFQIRGVFAVYGITVDPRHLSLIADYMTYNGGYKAMNRIGMKENSSAFLQMSFETTAAFLVDAALNGIKEPLNSPSANIVMGSLVKHGTGAFDCLVKAS
jgi:DNA-directed RNA polymerase I subunit RPA1